MIEVKTSEELQKLVKQSAYTITGAGGNLNDWEVGYNKFLKEADIGTPVNWYYFSGELMNTTYQLSGDNAYPDDLVFLCFPLDNLNVGKLAMFKLQHEDRWLDDIVDNDVERQFV